MKFVLSDEQVNKYSKFGLIFVGFLSFLFMFLILGAIILFPGEYSFFNSYLSDLGRKMTIEGYNNSTSSLLFSLAMILAGIATGLFWIFSQAVIYHSVPIQLKYKAPILIGSIFGLISAIFNMFIGIFPLDTETTMHYFVGAIFFSSVSIALFFYSIFFIYLFIKDKTSKLVIYTIISLIVPIGFAMIIIAYLNDIPTYLIMFLVFLFLLVNVIAQMWFKHLVNYLSFIISVSFIILLTLLVLLVIGTGIRPIIEIAFLIGLVAFVMTNNFKILRL